MKISFKWLSQYLETNLSPEKLSVILTDIGLEVESLTRIEAVKGGLEGVVVGEVMMCWKHPDADKLKVTMVDIGAEAPIQIVCGAPNVEAKQKVFVATEGSTIYPVGVENGIKIKRSKIRGIESFGMICAEDELGLGSSHDGIMVLEGNPANGTKAAYYMDIEDDFIFEIGLTPNRIDAASHYGVARDLAAYMRVHGIPVKLQVPSVRGIGQDNNKKSITVSVANSEACPRYMGLTISGVTVGPSPVWLQNNLRSIGLTPRNNVVDITNYILHALGQPLHAFDADKIRGGRIEVRTCPEGTPFTTLDGVERKLRDSDLMICDAEGPMCIAGVLGGTESGVSETTKTIFLESAYFNPVWVRKSAKYHGINTDASFRFERGCNPLGTSYSLLRAAMLIKVVAGGSISSKITDIYPSKIKPFAVDLSFASIDRVVGKKIERSVIKSILLSLDMTIVKETPDGMSVEIPPFRVDVRREIDVIEEILRIYGYNNIEIPLHVNSTLTYAKRPDRDKTVNTLSDLLSSNGYNEIMSNSLTRASYYEGNTVYGIEGCVKIVNPLSGDLNVMRRTLLYNSLEAAQLNINRRHSDLKLYEFGNCYHYNEGAGEGLSKYSEESRLSIFVTGNKSTASWNSKAESSDFFTLKAIVEKTLSRFGMNLCDAKTEALENDIYSQAYSYSFAGKRLFEMGILSKCLCGAFDIKSEAYYFEMNFDAFLALLKNKTITVKELQKYPEVRRDLALLVDRSVSFEQLRRIAFNTERKLLKNVTLFDVYEGDKLPEGKKSYALGFVLQDPDATMTDVTTDKIISKLISQFERESGAQVRN